MDAKRSVDVAVAGPALLMASPLIGLFALLVKAESPGPAIYSGLRVGRDGREFHIYKIRTMRADADRTGPAITVSEDRRVTRVGGFLRRMKLDELPQLWNVLAGDMSLVGPRPEHPEYVRQYTPEQRAVLAVRPGITGPAVLQFVDEAALLTGDAQKTYVTVVMPQKLELDLEYVRNRSFGRDLQILVKTAGLVVRRALRLA